MTTPVLHRLPILEPHRDALEKCVYCPKLSRAACPVSNAEPTESLTPWGKMSMAYFAGRGNVSLSVDVAAPAWGCTGCFACRERCDHRNDVAAALFDARAGLVDAGVAPPGVREAIERHPQRANEAAAVARGLRDRNGSNDEGSASILLGCGYLRHAPREAELAVQVVERLTGAPVTPVEACCGLPLLHAGDRPGFVRAANELARAVSGARPLYVLDPGCARALQMDYPRVGAAPVDARLFVDLVADNVDRLAPLQGVAAPRYHDPCQLGRGLGRFDGPRRILERLGGVREFARARERAECSGAGGLLVRTRPETSRAIADARIEEHRRLGGGTLVTACAASLKRFRAAGEPAEDLVTWIARGLGLC